MTALEAFEKYGTWDENGLAYIDGKRFPEFDIINELGQTAETED